MIPLGDCFFGIARKVMIGMGKEFGLFMRIGVVDSCR
jgi:hypothetical protein